MNGVLNRICKISNNVITLKMDSPNRTDFFTGVIALIYLGFIQFFVFYIILDEKNNLLLFDSKSEVMLAFIPGSKFIFTCLVTLIAILKIILLFLPSAGIIFTCLRNSYVNIDLNKKTISIPKELNELKEVSKLNIKHIKCLLATEFINYIKEYRKGSEVPDNVPERLNKIFIYSDDFKEPLCIYTSHKLNKNKGEVVTLNELNNLIKFLAEKMDCDFVVGKENVQLRLIFDNNTNDYRIDEHIIDSNIPESSFNERQAWQFIITMFILFIFVIIFYIVIYIIVYGPSSGASNIIGK